MNCVELVRPTTRSNSILTVNQYKQYKALCRRITRDHHYSDNLTERLSRIADEQQQVAMLIRNDPQSPHSTTHARHSRCVT